MSKQNISDKLFSGNVYFSPLIVKRGRDCRIRLGCLSFIFRVRSNAPHFWGSDRQLAVLSGKVDMGFGLADCLLI